MGVARRAHVQPRQLWRLRLCRAVLLRCPSRAQRRAGVVRASAGDVQELQAAKEALAKARRAWRGCFCSRVASLVSGVGAARGGVRARRNAASSRAAARPLARTEPGVQAGQLGLAGAGRGRRPGRGCAAPEAAAARTLVSRARANATHPAGAPRSSRACPAPAHPAARGAAWSQPRSPTRAPCPVLPPRRRRGHARGRCGGARCGVPSRSQQGARAPTQHSAAQRPGRVHSTRAHPRACLCLPLSLSHASVRSWQNATCKRIAARNCHRRTRFTRRWRARVTPSWWLTSTPTGARPTPTPPLAHTRPYINPLETPLHFTKSAPTTTQVRPLQADDAQAGGDGG
jgi:hypothetical protein